MTHRTKIALCILALSSAGGCAASQAVGSKPADMTPEGHCAAAAHERTRAGSQRNAAGNVAAGKLTVENRLRAEHDMSARTHERHAAQHEQAALMAAGGNMPPCGLMQR